VMPVGPDGSQTLVRLTRTGSTSYREEPLADVRFVPLIGAQGFHRSRSVTPFPSRRSQRRPG
jgi:protein-L-isoaspartate(D-aspartate) O-methyltransferase